jgi:hypothetical protein
MSGSPIPGPSARLSSSGPLWDTRSSNAPTRQGFSLDNLGAHNVMPVSRAQATVYAVALLGLWVGFAFVVLSPGLDGTLRVLAEAVAAPVVFICFSAIFAIAVLRVQRGEVAGERDGVVLPVMAEYILMSFGGRLPIALASLRG